MRFELLSEEISNATKGNQDHVTDIGGYKIEIRRLVDYKCSQIAAHVLADISVVVRAEGSKLGVETSFSFILGWRSLMKTRCMELMSGFLFWCRYRECRMNRWRREFDITCRIDEMCFFVDGLGGSSPDSSFILGGMTRTVMVAIMPIAVPVVILTPGTGQR
jgi:hypothetical protein